MDPFSTLYMSQKKVDEAEFSVQVPKYDEILK